MHGGSPRNPTNKIAQRRAEEQARRQVAKLGGSRDVHPLEALLEMVREAAANVAVLRVHVQDKANTQAVYDDRGRPYTNPVLAFYNDERDRLARVAKAALEAGVDERRVKLAELHAARLGEALGRALDDEAAALSEGQRGALRVALARELRRQLEPAAA